jgi:hypothetical protein
MFFGFCGYEPLLAILVEDQLSGFVTGRDRLLFLPNHRGLRDETEQKRCNQGNFHQLNHDGGRKQKCRPGSDESPGDAEKCRGQRRQEEGCVNNNRGGQKQGQ